MFGANSQHKSAKVRRLKVNEIGFRIEMPMKLGELTKQFTLLGTKDTSNRGMWSV